MIGIIGAMEEEIEILKSQMVALEEIKIAHTVFYKGLLNDKEIILTQSGIGKVNVAISTALLINEFKPSYIINTGSAGALQPGLSLGDVVISSEVAYHDADARAFGYEIGQIPGMPATYKADQELFKKVDKVLKSLSQNGKEGLIVSGDSFIGTNAQRQTILASFPHALAAEMEAAAIAQTCFQFNTPFIITRAISDLADEEAGMTFEAFLKVASQSSSKMVSELVKEL
ncbi:MULTISPECIES: 5'-methylthioadenosine/adenosylhomocysteine nucleosidase [Staphylococcus]|uniref:5'-methylthioadenosine/S-adenosylhomocysteine nucleosidase n=1 Tax=Staphylococcus schleiferi TaxID=1295 RepID=A0A7Z7QPQ2_STASC|nr:MULTISPECIES: 5'-methylthioadenosine/adenosylhomocysteine nucleosidase [Staphylococcus]QGS45549.1 5'-methylthioadenosine/adenosylhomocysteine nucleosidase [Mammaliicoccus fleurettii]EPD51857.1 MTA/SAH nucleosidase [Staphylococcus sp. HGB0015]MBF1993770.1 5'-methylthioadenosine/adenosylhomocysteine nucleosidase [Staphylococcus schleiferi]MBF2039281.1 5'-methylthioadenosine/adenosylhomocysteine nucleosidase [Staphylococcus schleiferi]MBF2101280.1 5'-methylthioadenosine/adenosylhomocysteine nu